MSERKKEKKEGKCLGHAVQETRVVFEAEASGGGVRQVISPTLPFPLSLPSPFPFPYISDKPVGGKVRSSEGEVPRLPPPTNTTLPETRLHGRAVRTNSDESEEIPK